MTNFQAFPEHPDPPFDHRLDHNVPPHHHHHNMDFMIDRCADRCDDQLPLFSQVGRGLRGDSFLVRIKSDSDRETILEGLVRDEHTGEYHTEWVSENINGGRLSYTYNLRPYGEPNTFTITFRLQRPNRPEWVWTTPPIPYIWDADNDGVADIDGITGVGVGTLFIKPTGETTWADVRTAVAATDGPNDIPEALAAYEKLLYPEDWTRSELNAPLPGDPYTVNLEYGIGGDIDAPNIDDLAKILGVTPTFLRLIVAERDVPTTETFGTKPNGDPLNTKEYIDKGDEDVLAHFHADLGGNASGLAGDDSDSTTGWPYTQKYGSNVGQTTVYQTVWDYLQAIIIDLNEGIIAAQNAADAAQAAADKANRALGDILSKIVGGPTMNATTGEITWPAPLNASGSKIAGGNINLYSGTTETLSSAKGIFTHTGNSANDDLKGV